MLDFSSLDRQECELQLVAVICSGIPLHLRLPWFHKHFPQTAAYCSLLQFPGARDTHKPAKRSRVTSPQTVNARRNKVREDSCEFRLAALEALLPT
jgi:hypothetical protein